MSQINGVRSETLWLSVYAFGCIELLLAYHPRSTLGWVNRGIVQHDDDPADAFVSYLKASSLDPSFGLPRMLMGKSLRDLGDWIQAEDHLRAALDLGADPAETLLVLGDVLKAQRRLDEAFAAYNISLQVSSAQAVLGCLARQLTYV